MGQHLYGRESIFLMSHTKSVRISGKVAHKCGVACVAGKSSRRTYTGGSRRPTPGYVKSKKLLRGAVAPFFRELKDGESGQVLEAAPAQISLCQAGRLCARWEV